VDRVVAIDAARPAPLQQQIYADHVIGVFDEENQYIEKFRLEKDALLFVLDEPVPRVDKPMAEHKSGGVHPALLHRDATLESGAILLASQKKHGP